MKVQIYLFFIIQYFLSQGSFQERPKHLGCLTKKIRNRQNYYILILKLSSLTTLKDNITEIYKDNLTSNTSQNICLTLSFFCDLKYQKELSKNAIKNIRNKYVKTVPNMVKYIGERKKRESRILLKSDNNNNFRKIKKLYTSTKNNIYPQIKNNTKRENVLKKTRNINDILGRPKNYESEIEKNYEDVLDPIKPELFTLKNTTKHGKVKFVNNTHTRIREKNQSHGKLNLSNIKLLHTQRPTTFKLLEKTVLGDKKNNATEDKVIHTDLEEHTTEFVILTTRQHLINSSNGDIFNSEVKIDQKLENNTTVKEVLNNGFKESFDTTEQIITNKSNIIEPFQNNIDDMKANNEDKESGNIEKGQPLQEEFQNLLHQIFHYGKLNQNFWNFTFGHSQNDNKKEYKHMHQNSDENWKESYEYFSDEYDSELAETHFKNIMNYLNVFRYIVKLNYDTEDLELLKKSSLEALLQYILDF